jgi:hypothetical protein
VNEFTRLLEQYYHLIERNKGESEDALKIRSRLNELSIDDPEITASQLFSRQFAPFSVQGLRHFLVN